MFLPRLKSTERSAFVATAMHFAALSGPMSLNVARHLAYVAREANIKLDGSLAYDDTATLEAIDNDIAKGVFVTELMAFSHITELNEDVHLNFIRDLGHRLALASDVLEHVDAWAQQYQSMWQAGQHMIEAFTADNLSVEAPINAPPLDNDIGEAPAESGEETSSEPEASAFNSAIEDDLHLSEDDLRSFEEDDPHLSEDDLRAFEEDLHSLEEKDAHADDVSIHDISDHHEPDPHKGEEQDFDIAQLDKLALKDELSPVLDLSSSSEPLAPNSLSSEDLSHELSSLETISPGPSLSSSLTDDQTLLGPISADPETLDLEAAGLEISGQNALEPEISGPKAPDTDLYIANPLLAEIEDEPLGLLQEDDLIEAKSI